MDIRILNDNGINQFTNYIRKRRAGEDILPPFHLLEDSDYSCEIDISINIDKSIKFESRYELGCYLVKQFENVDIQPYIGVQGFWSWLALFWFEQLSPHKEGKYKPAMDYNYVLSKNYNHRPRHSIYMTWQLVNQSGPDVRFMLSKEPHTRGEITEQLMARQEILSSTGVLALGNYLYFDEQSKSFKRGAAARKSAGCVTRLVAWVQQLQLTFDIFSISKDELILLLPSEFDKFRE